MIDVRIIAKKKTASSGGSTGGGMNYPGSSTSSDYASKAGYATSAGTAAEATHAGSADKAAEAEHASAADKAAEAEHAASSAALDADSPTREDFVSSTHDDEAAGEIAFEAGVKFGSHGSENGIDAGGNAVLSTVQSRQLSDDIKNAVLNRTLVGGQGYELYTDEKGRSHLWVDELDVRTKAQFASLEIRKVSYAGGTQIYSNAGSIIVKVLNVYATEGDADPSAYKCYSKADDGTTATSNWWKVGMQALCQTFNVQAGVYENISNRYYWRLVIGVGQERLSDGLLYDYVVLSNVRSLTPSTVIPTWDDSALSAGAALLQWGSSGVLSVVKEGTATWGSVTGDDRVNAGYDPTGTDAPQPFDVIVQVGDQLNPTKYGNVTKQSTSTEDDTAGVAPSYDMYYAIDDFSWDGHQTAHVSPSGTFFNSNYFKFYAGDITDAKPVTVYMGEWQTGRTYYEGQQVTYDGQLYTYVSEEASTAGVAPSSKSGWELSVAKGSKGEDAVSIAIDPSAVCFNQDDEKSQSSRITTVVYKGATHLEFDTSKAYIQNDYYVSNISVTDGWTANNIVSRVDADKNFYFLAYAMKGTTQSGTLTFDVVVGGVAYPQRVPLSIATKGEKGDAGTSVSIKGSLSSTAELPSSGQTLGDGYLIDGDLWVYAASSEEGSVNGFVNVGQIKGDAGQSAYLHIAYASDGNGTDFSTVYDASKHTYIGIYTDFTATGSDAPAAYQWRKFVGKDGEPGKAGQDGWSVRLNPSVLSLEDGDLTEAGNVFTCSAKVAVEVYHGSEKATLTSLSASEWSRCSGTLSLSEGIIINTLDAVAVTDASGSYLKDENGAVIYLPVGAAKVSVTVNATDVDGHAMGEQTVTLDIAVSYRKQFSEILQTAGKISLKVTAVETAAGNAQKAADEAQSSADDAQGAADTAQKSADAAQSAAEDAQNGNAQTVAQLKEAGIDIESREINLYAERVKVTNDGTTAAMFEDGKLNADLINAEEIDVQHVFAKDAAGTTVGHFGCSNDTKNATDYPLWVGGSTPTEAPFSVSKAGALYSVSGLIGGFTISQGALAAGRADQGESVLTLSKNTLTFSSQYASTGLSSSCVIISDNAGTGLTASRGKMFIREDYPGALAGCNFGIEIEVSGNKANTSADAEAGNHAIIARKGDYLGLRPHTRILSESTTLSKLDHTLSCRNTAEITLTLPADPEQGQEYRIMQVNPGRILFYSANHEFIVDGRTGLDGNPHYFDSNIQGQFTWLVFDGNAWIGQYVSRS